MMVYKNDKSILNMNFKEWFKENLYNQPTDSTFLNIVSTTTMLTVVLFVGLGVVAVAASLLQHAVCHN